MLLVALTVAARVVDAWPASSREIQTVSALAASNGPARSFMAASLSASGRPSRKELRRWRAKIVAIEGAGDHAGGEASERVVRGATQDAQIGAQYR